MPSCSRHPFDQAVDVCSRCEDSVCTDCRVEARRRTYCLDCALAAAGVKSSGRSGKSAVEYRRRVNGLNAAALAAPPREIDLRDDRGSVALAPRPTRESPTRPSRLARDLQAGTPAPPPPARIATRHLPPTPRRPAALPPLGIPAAPSGTLPPGPPRPTAEGSDQDPSGRRRLLTLLAGVGAAGVAGTIVSACGGGGGTNEQLRLPPVETGRTPGRTRPGPARQTPAVAPATTDAGAATSAGQTGSKAASTVATPTTRPGPPGNRPPGTTPVDEVPPPAPGPGPAPAPGPTPDPGPGPAPTPVPDPISEAMRQARLIERITFGPTPDLITEVIGLGSRAFLEQQLALPPAGTAGVLTGPTILDATPPQLDAILVDVNRNTRIPNELRHAALVRAVHHRGQLAEMMVDFWSNHLSTYSGEDDKNVKYAAALDDRDVIRPHAMGRVADLVLASARSVSMQLYLDNFRSNAANPNQNYARELMELHTLGAGNGYDETDVDQVARILSGWGLQGNIGRFEDVTFAFNPSRHFTGPLTVTITARDGTVQTWSTPGRSGPEAEQDGIDFIDWLTHLPNTARFISRKLARRFVGDTVSEALVDSMAAVYLANDTQIVPVLRHILTSAEFESSRRTKVKTPFELLAGMIRSTGATVDRTAGGAATNTVGGQLGGLGHTKWSWPTPDGIPDDPVYWITTSTVLRRWELAGRLANGRLDGITVDRASLFPNPLPATVGEVLRALAERLGTGVDETALSAISAYLGTTHDAPTSTIDVDRVGGDMVAMLLSVPAYQYR